MEQFDRDNIPKKVQSALDKLMQCDSSLLQIDANERSITHRLAMYLQEEFEDWDVDGEYNRDNHPVKRLRLTEEFAQTNDTDGKTVFPDIIIHHRRTDQNLLVIEVKKIDV
jgi:hypothetical protein